MKFGNEILEGRGPGEIQNLGGLEAEGAVEKLDALEFPAVRAGFDDFKRQGVEEFVGEMDAGEWRQSLGRFDPLDAPTREAGLLFFAREYSFPSSVNLPSRMRLPKRPTLDPK